MAIYCIGNYFGDRAENSLWEISGTNKLSVLIEILWSRTELRRWRTLEGDRRVGSRACRDAISDLIYTQNNLKRKRDALSPFF